MDGPDAATAAPQHPPWRRYPWLVPGGLLLILAFLTVNVLADGPTVAMDRRIRAIVLARANSAAWKWIKDRPYSPARVLIELGNVRVAIPVLAVTAVVVALRHHALRPLLTAGAGAALLLATVVPAKILTARPNPGFATLNGQLLGAFPSGHTTTSGVCYVLAVLLLVSGQPARTRRIALTSAAVLTFLVGAAMVWCDLHWFTDVAAGWALTPLLIGLTMRLTGARAASGERLPEPLAESEPIPGPH